MKQNVSILTSNCCEALLTFTSKPQLRQLYNQSKFDSANLEFVKGQTKYFIDDNLQLGASSKDDCQSCIDIFTQFVSLDGVQANDKRLWVSLTHTHLFNYTRERWGINSESSDNKVTDRFHFEGSGIDSRMGNSLSRLWWTARVTSDKRRSDEFELTRLSWE